MPITLDTAWNAGSAGDSAEYGEAKVVEFRLRIEPVKSMLICVEFGDTVDGVWVKGVTDCIQYRYDEDTVADFLADNAATYASVAATLYAFMQDVEVTKLAGDVA